MAIGDKVYIADKETLDEINVKIGKTNDAPTSSISTGSLFAKINYLVSSIASYLLNIYNYVIKIGATTDTGGSTTTGTIMGKLNSLQNNGAIKSIQRGTIQGDAVERTRSILINPVSVNKTVIILSGSFDQSGSGSYNVNYKDFNGNSFVIYANRTFTQEVSWQAVEYN